MRGLAIILLMCAAHEGAAGEIPGDFPRFVVPGQQRQMDSLRSLFWLHYEHAGPLIPLWDEWMSMATLWPARSDNGQLNVMRKRWAAALAGRVIGADGYVHTQQHDGLAHAEGWPFPFWIHAGGVGWHFRGTGVPGYDAPLVEPKDWTVTGGQGGEVDEKGWRIELEQAEAFAVGPEFSIDAVRSPWVRVNWWPEQLVDATPYVEWTTADEPEFSPERRMYVRTSPDGEPLPLFDQVSAGGPPVAPVGVEVRTMVPVYRHAKWKGQITRLRIGFGNKLPAALAIKSFHTAPDTRHNVNNLNFIRGCHDYVMWSGDTEFLRGQMGRIRTAMRFVEREFQPREKKCMYTTWPGHEGRTGVERVNGEKIIRPGEGIGSNYWDLLPFGGEDALATVYLYDTLHDLAELEELIREQPASEKAQGDAYDPVDLRQLAREVKEYGGRRFWNGETGRFGTVDLDGQLHDYGFTFLNNEAVSLGFATDEQARSIYEWLSGHRIIAGDTSLGDDIYYWHFGPRSTTLRNLDYYVWNWSAPESIPWGYQVQDGGAVLGWSYYDLLMRLKTAGPDDAAARLGEIVAWFEKTQAEGGYRAYYAKDASRGTLQGGNVAGGLGLDREFFESVLVPQVMLYGFLGFTPTADGFEISPKLPSDWPALTITQIHLHGHVLEVTATQTGAVTVTRTGGDPAAADEPIVVSGVAPHVKLQGVGCRLRRE